MYESSVAGPVVAIIDDDVAVRESLANLFKSVGINTRLFAGIDEFIATGATETTACVVLDVRLPGRSGIEFQHELRNVTSEMPIVFISGHADVSLSVQAMKGGAIDFLTKPVREQDLLDAVHAALARDKNIRESRGNMDALRMRFEGLSTREREVMVAVVGGARNKQVAARLGVSEATIKLHRSHVMSKMGAKSFADLVRMADRLIS